MHENPEFFVANFFKTDTKEYHPKLEHILYTLEPTDISCLLLDIYRKGQSVLVFVG